MPFTSTKIAGLFGALSLVVVTATGCASSADPASEDGQGADETGSDEGALTTTPERQAVYDEVKSSAHHPRDLLDANLTDEKLVQAVGWLVDHDAPPFYITAIRSDHHNDGERAHAGGHAMDFYAKSGGDARRLIELADQNPYVVEIGLGGVYKKYRNVVNDKQYFNDNSATHIHIGVIHAFGH